VNCELSFIHSHTVSLSAHRRMAMNSALALKHLKWSLQLNLIFDLGLIFADG